MHCNIKTKKEVRKQCRKRRDALSDDDRKKLSKIVSQRIVKFILQKNFFSIGLYFPIGSEVDVLEVYRTIQKNYFSKKFSFFLPRMYGNTLIFLSFHGERWGSSYFLQKGKYGILQPYKDFSFYKKNNIPECVLVPGVWFTHDWQRIGYGGGYYDRFLSRYRNRVFSIGIGYDFQKIIFDWFQSHDQRVNMVL